MGDGLWDFLNNAAIRIAGRPHTVSEYQQHWPNRQAAEIDPTLAIFASFQDWDGLMHCCYSTRFLSDPNSALMAYNPSQYSNIGQAAWLFRTFAVAAGKSLWSSRCPRIWNSKWAGKSGATMSPTFWRSSGSINRRSR